MGVRAVVAAGWAVDDAAANDVRRPRSTRRCSRGNVRRGREDARGGGFERHPGSNTWGAYQCYGDPAYRLIVADDQAPSKTEPPRIVSPAHAAQNLSNIAARLKTGATQSAAGELARVEEIAKIIEQKGWKDNGLVQAALARAYAEAGKLDAALPLYRRALSTEDGAASMRDIEQLANLEVRHAMADGGPAAR